MDVKTDANGGHYVMLGCKLVGRSVKPVRLELGTNKEVAKQRADRLWSLWERQNGCWTDQGLKQADVVANGFRP